MAERTKRAGKNVQVQVKFSIERIALVKSQAHLPDGVALNSDNKDIEYSFDIRSLIDPEKKLIQIIVRYVFFYKTGVVFEMDVENDYKVSNVFDVFDNGKIINEEFFQNLIAMSVNHARGIQSTLNHGTSIERLYMPRINKKNLKATPVDQPENHKG